MRPNSGHPGWAGSVASIGGTLIVGGYRIASPTDPMTTGSVWSSSDGKSWAVKELAPGEGLTVVADGTHALAVSAHHAWTSTDGRDWVAAAAPSDTPTGVVVALPSGGFLASATTADTSVCSLWFTHDGSAWAKRSSPNHGACPSGLAAGPDGLVAAGLLDVGHGWLSFSADLGVSWKTEVSGRPSVFTSLAAVNGGFLATTKTYGPSGPVRGETWRSSDGRSWDRVGTFGTRQFYEVNQLRSIVRFGGRYLAFGYSAGIDDTIAEARISTTGAVWGPAPWGKDRYSIDLYAATVWKSRIVVVGQSDNYISIGDEPVTKNVLVFIGRSG